MKAGLPPLPSTPAARFDGGAKWLFGAGAGTVVVLLALLTLFLLREAMVFFPESRAQLEAYRQSGGEAVAMVETIDPAWADLLASLHAIRSAEYRDLAATGRDFAAIQRELREFDGWWQGVASTAAPMRQLLQEETFARSATLSAAEATALITRLSDGLQRWAAESGQALEPLPPLRSQAALDGRLTMEEAHTRWQAACARTLRRLAAWDSAEPVTLLQALGQFFSGSRWLAYAGGRSEYGLLPLLLGSFVVAGVALSLAAPLAIGMAVFTFHYARRWERKLIVPVMEVTAVIPAVLLGFLGMAVLGDVLRHSSEWALFRWLPGFPLLERLNPLTAGILLAIMATPTIFILAEQALRRVAEGMQISSYALGANRWQTLLRIVLPQAMPGLIAGLLLGFTRVLGETMIVLLCSGNRLAVPLATDDPNGLFAPVHTMTGLIAQEMGEVTVGTLHYHALFLLGLILFLLTLLLNFGIHRVLFRLRLSYA